MADSVFNSFMIHTYAAFREDDAVGALKLPSVDYDAFATGTCWIKPLSSENKQAVAGFTLDAEYKIYLVGTSTIREGDVFNITGAGRLNGTYQIQAVEEYPDESGVHHLTCYAKKQIRAVAE